MLYELLSDIAIICRCIDFVDRWAFKPLECRFFDIVGKTHDFTNTYQSKDQEVILWTKKI